MRKRHQRQKERRAQELHERCSGYLMSRKLEGLAQQLVTIRFSYERATMAIILNEGKVEQSVAWLFEGGAPHKPNHIHGLQILGTEVKEPHSISSEGTCNHDATAKIEAHIYDFSSSSSAFIADWNPSVVE
ncbi:UBA-like protein [Tanacetum coccineum]